MSQRGQLYVFEGVDGCGKSSISVALERDLRSKGDSARLFSFPGKSRGTLGELVYRVHHGPQALGLSSLTPASLQALHIAAHLDTIESSIIPALSVGTTVVLDRYWWSTWCYGRACGVPMEILNSLIEAERKMWGTWMPSHVFYVERTKPEDGTSSGLREQILKAYQELLAHERARHPVQVIENNGSPEASLAQVLSYIL